MITIVSAIIIGLLAGVLSGLFGLAGGTIIVPGLMILCSFSQLQANGTSLAANLLPVGILGVVTYWKNGLVKLSVVIPLVGGLLLGVWGGSFTAVAIPPFWHKISFGMFLALLSLRFFLYRSSSQDDAVIFPPHQWRGLFLAGMLAGIFSGLFGIGGGVIMLLIMTEFFHFSQRQASASSLATLLFPAGIAGVLHYHSQGDVAWIPAAVIAGGLVFGIFLGAKLHLKIPEKIVRRSFGIYLCIVGVAFIVAAFVVHG